MTITRDAHDVWNEIRDKAEKLRKNNTPIYTLVREVPNYVVKVENDRIWRQSSEPFSQDGGPSVVRQRAVENIWNELRQKGQAVEGELHALRFAWALVGTFI